VDSDVGDQEIKAFVKLLPGRDEEPLDIIKHCENRLAYFQVPRYLAFVTEFAKTPTHRIQKNTLSRSSTDCWDLVMSGYSLRRI
jgi:crotonobetaine/carnitine-CoA ligase